MVRRSSATRYRQGTRNGGARRRRRSSLMSRVRYQRGTARQQKSQIKSIARLSIRANRILNQHKIYQDWELSSGISFAVPGWTVEPFMNPIAWNACLRKDLTPLTQSGCFLREMQFSYFMANNTKNLPSTISLFLVTLRRQQNFAGVMAAGDEYVTQGEANQPIINAGIFKVHWSRTHQIYPPVQAVADPSGVTLLPSGNPATQYRKGKTTLSLKYKLRSPSDQSWKQLSQEDFPYYQSLYLLAFFQNEDASSATNAQLTYGLKFTTITQD